jgi:AcrR family transcriptional regulator
MSTSPTTEEPIDGRTARAVRTKDAIVEACLALIDEGDLRPTAPRIADRAGVSVRSIFQHFDDLEALFSAVGDKVRDRLATLVRRIDPAAPRSERVEQFVAQRSAVLEAVSPVLRAAIVHSVNSKVIGQQFEGGHAFFRDQVQEAFAPELAIAGVAGQLRPALLVATSWSTWDLLRRTERLDPAAAAAVMAWMVTVVLDQIVDD